MIVVIEIALLKLGTKERKMAMASVIKLLGSLKKFLRRSGVLWGANLSNSRVDIVSIKRVRNITKHVTSEGKKINFK